MKVRAPLGKLRGPVMELGDPVGKLGDPVVDLRFRWGSSVFGGEGPRTGDGGSFLVMWVRGGVGEVRGAVNRVSARLNGRLAAVAATGRLGDSNRVRFTCHVFSVLTKWTQIQTSGHPMAPNDLHAQLRAARRAHQRAEFSLAVLLCELKSTGRYTERGHTSVESYAEAELDLTVRQTRDLVAIGRHMRELPALAAAFSDGRLSATKAREVARVATPDTDAAWTERACVSTSRLLERRSPPRAGATHPRRTLRRSLRVRA